MASEQDDDDVQELILHSVCHFGAPMIVTMKGKTLFVRCAICQLVAKSFELKEPMLDARCAMCGAGRCSGHNIQPPNHEEN